MRAIVAMACANLAACAANPAPVLAPPLPAQVPSARADAPVFQIGQEWAFSFVNDLDAGKSGGYSQRVERAEKGHAILSVIVNGAPGVGELDENACVVRGPDALFTPSNRALQFPLFVGKTWAADYLYSSGAWTAKDHREAKVVSFEQVATHAGALDAFRVESTIVWSGVAAGSDAGRARETDWYAPSVGRIVKQRFEDYPNNKNAAPTATRYELVRYSPTRANDN